MDTNVIFQERLAHGQVPGVLVRAQHHTEVGAQVRQAVLGMLEALAPARAQQHLQPVADVRVDLAPHDFVVDLPVGDRAEGSQNDGDGDQELLLLDHHSEEHVAVGDVVQRDALGRVVFPHALHLAGEAGEVGPAVQVGVALEGQGVVAFLQN